MNVPFAVAGVCALIGAAIHGVVGERLVVSKLNPEMPPSSSLGGRSASKLMIRASWHIATVTFIVMGAALAACAPGESNDACRGVGRVTALSYAGFLVLVVGLGARGGPRGLMRHPAPLLFSLVAVCAWWGASL